MASLGPYCVLPPTLVPKAAIESVDAPALADAATQSVLKVCPAQSRSWVCQTSVLVRNIFLPRSVRGESTETQHRSLSRVEDGCGSALLARYHR